MKRVINISLCVCAFLIGMCAHVYAQEPGAACRTAIPMGKDYKADVQNGQTIWYSAWTFDLPLTVTFAPKNGKNDPAPEVEMDFTCTQGYYSDSILCSLFCKTSGSSGIDMGLPHKPNLSSKTLDDGTFVYYLSIGKRYRDLLLQVGISYNVEVFVKVTYKSNGKIMLAPDDLFSNCVDNAQFMRYGDTAHFAANDTNRHIIVPYLQWQEDTVIYKWTGTMPCEVVVANTCDFMVHEQKDDIIERENIQPGDSVKVKAIDLYDWVHNPAYPNEAGMYFAKVYSAAPGDLIVRKAPHAPLDKNAILLRYNMSYPVDANSKGVYAIPRTWNKDLQFTATTEHMFSIVFSKTANFGAADTLDTYPLQRSETGHWIGITSTDMSKMWTDVPNDRNYIYIRFICSEATVVTPERWFMSDCYKKTVVEPGVSFTVTRTSSTVYRFIYSQWKGGNMTINFAINSNCEIYLANTCAMNMNKSDASYWLRYKSIVNNTAPVVIPAVEIASWANMIDDEGCFYGLFYTKASGTNRKLTITTTAPEEADPVYPTATIAVACDEMNKPYVEVSKAQTLTIKNEQGTIAKTINAVPNAKYSLSDLSSGKYTVQGETENITINL